jgi:hypothetical protein
MLGQGHAWTRKGDLYVPPTALEPAAPEFNPCLVRTTWNMVVHVLAELSKNVELEYRKTDTMHAASGRLPLFKRFTHQALPELLPSNTIY